jgi:two-component system chemotaxis response regulator CheB
MLPVMSGLGATEYIMAHCPTPILVVSASTNRGELFKTYEALAAGAVDVLEKPSGDESDTEWERRFVATVKLIARIPVITHVRGRLPALSRPRTRERNKQAPPASRQRYEVVVLGASTGGPGAILEVLRGLRQPFPLPILLVLHIGEPFGRAFAEWLDGQTEFSVSYARDGDVVKARTGGVVMAPPDSHLVVRDRRLRVTNDPPRHSCRPSVDVLFETVAREYGPATIAGLLTGMGRDGAGGLLAIRQAGGFTIAQDEATSVVYGMPREAVLLGAVERVLPLSRIGPMVSALVTDESPNQGT